MHSRKPVQGAEAIAEARRVARIATCNCAVECKDCGETHYGELPPLTPCPRCGSGVRYHNAGHHRCLGTW